MFFDDLDTTDSYENYLILIAKKQKELFDNCFNWNEKQRYMMSESRRRKEMQLLKELHFLKEELEKYRESMGYSGEIFWWNLSWEEIEKYLLYDLENPPENEKWRFEYEWLHTGGGKGCTKCFYVKRGIVRIFLLNESTIIRKIQIIVQVKEPKWYEILIVA